MEDKLEKLYSECLNELKTINLDFSDKKKFGEIDIKIAKRKSKRYGCCKYDKFNIRHIEISKWTMELNDDIIKNTIIHELIHCIPYCNNHGKEFKYYAKIVKENLGYNITRLGNKEEDYKKSGLEFPKEEKKITYKYKIICNKCGEVYFRQRMKKYFLKRYVCGKCRRKTNYNRNLIIVKIL